MKPQSTVLGTQMFKECWFLSFSGLPHLPWNEVLCTEALCMLAGTRVCTPTCSEPSTSHPGERYIHVKYQGDDIVWRDGHLPVTLLAWRVGFWVVW